MNADNDRHSAGVVDAARRAIARVVVSELPDLDISVTGPKAVDAAVRGRIALVLDVDPDDFDVTVQGLHRRRPARLAP